MKTSEVIKERLKQVESREERLDKLESEFIAVASHEFKNPLTIIKGAVSLVKEGDLGEVNEKQCDMLRRADEQVDVLNGLITKLLDIYRIEMGKLEISRQEISISEIAHQVANEMSIKAMEKDVTIEIASHGSTDNVLGDALKIKEVISDLLSNAIKFSYFGGKVRIKITGEGGCVRTEVTDDGEGIEDEIFTNLFHKFITSVVSNPKQDGGLGLGLGVAKGIVEAHGGKIWAESEGPGKGSRFTFTLPSQDLPPVTK
jgi:signal transduction histidine kinase